MPGEIEKSAELLGMTTQEFFDKYVIVDYWFGDDTPGNNTVFTLSPLFGNLDSKITPISPLGCCVFLDENSKCRIHEAKPFECKSYLHDTAAEQAKATHIACRDAWNTVENQAQITKLLGYEPNTPDPSWVDIFELLGGFKSRPK